MPSDVFNDFLAGCFGGAAGVLAGYPLDTVKVHLQIQCAVSPQYRGIFHCFHCIVSREGPGALYKGMSSPLASLALINALVFGVHGIMKKLFADQHALSTHFFAGAAAGATQAIVSSPMELLKLRVQLHQPDQVGCQSPYHLLRHILREKGIRYLGRGMLASQLRDCPAVGVYFASYECLRRQMSGAHSSSTEELSSWKLLLAGGGAGMLSWLCNYPTDVVKTRFQANDNYTSYLHVIRQTYARNGIRGFYAGLGSTLVRAFPTNAATFLVVEWTYRLLLQRPMPATEKILMGQYDESWPIAVGLLLLPEAGCTLLEPVIH